MKNIIKIIIEGRLDGLNEYTLENRSNKYSGNKVKKNNERHVLTYLHKAKPLPIVTYPITVRTTWYEPNKRRDADNIVFAKKFILDTFVKYGLLKNDGQKQINKFVDIIKVDTVNPRIEVELYVEEKK